MGGTGTIVELEEHTEILEKTERLLSKLNWEGIALVEFKLADGEPVLMEINPKFWASYPLASKNGYRFASQIISDTMDISIKQPARNLDATMVFPTRELYFVLKNKENESVIDSVGSMIAFGSQVDFNIEDFQAWFFPAGFANTIRWPIDLLRKKHDPIDEL
jgi:predicted ATP-grasp superfamily ATP-dependent carboligase